MIIERLNKEVKRPKASGCVNTPFQTKCSEMDLHIIQVVVLSHRYSLVVV